VNELFRDRKATKTKKGHQIEAFSLLRQLQKRKEGNTHQHTLSTLAAALVSFLLIDFD
jgi:mannose/cellobiose epimerase-like protein (N-acyl-D-glucosamine 2-epimerase family)